MSLLGRSCRHSGSSACRAGWLGKAALLCRVIGAAWLTGSASAPAGAEQHTLSGIILPDRIDGMPASASSPGRFGELARMLVYQDGGDRVEITVFKAAHPNASIWFKDGQWRAETLLAAGHPVTSAGQPVTVASRVPNGLTARIDFDAHYASAAIATVGFDDWIVSVLSVSKGMDAAAQQKRLGGILAQIRKPAIQQAYPPIVTIERCAASAGPVPYAMVPQDIAPRASIEEATVAGLVARASSLGSMLREVGAIGRSPASYCWTTSESGKTKWFTAKAAAPAAPGQPAWLSTLSWGWTVEGWAMPPAGKVPTHAAALVVNDFSQTKVVGLYRALPYPALAMTTAMLGALVPSRIAFVERGKDAINLVQPE